MKSHRNLINICLVLLIKWLFCETLSGKTITGVLTGYNKCELLLVETKDIKLKKPMKTLVYKNGVVSIRETE